MSEPRHNSHLIVTVLTACVALLCGVPAAQGAQAKPNLAELPTSYHGAKNEVSLEARLTLASDDERFIRRSVRLIRLSNFRPASLVQLLDLAALLPRINFLDESTSFPRDLFPVSENTHPVSQPINLRMTTRLPRAGLA